MEDRDVVVESSLLQAGRWTGGANRYLEEQQPLAVSPTSGQQLQSQSVAEPMMHVDWTAGSG